MEKRIKVDLDLGDAKREALRYVSHNPDVLLRDFLRVYPARARQPLAAELLGLPLRQFEITPVTLRAEEGFAPPAPAPADGGDAGAGGALRRQLDGLYADDVAATAEPAVYPDHLADGEAVQVAYRHELQAVARFLKNDLSVLIICDKILTEHIYEYVCQQAGRTPVLDDSPPTPPANARAGLDQALRGPAGPDENVRLLLRNLKAGQVLVLRSLDILDTPPLIELLYQSATGSRKPQLLAFLDPSLEVRKVLTDRFAIRVGIQGLPRYIQPDRDKPPTYTVPHLITAHERRCFREFDPEGLYKNVAGLNAIQFRNAMRYVGAEVAPDTPARAIYDQIRQFKTSSASDEIEIPDTTFDDIGGYEAVKHELQRIVALVTGRVQGIDERERQKLIPRGFVFHGKPGTGKTLFAKAIANEMNATIQMISGPEIMDKYVGQSESNLRHIFATARRNAPSVIFFDEFDSLAGQRSNYSDGGARANNAVVAQLLTELDGFREEQAVLVIGTTNRIDIIDEALLRPSRLQPIEIPMPDYAARRKVAGIHAERFGVDKLVQNLCALALEHLAAWSADGQIPQAYLNALFAQHPAYAIRYRDELDRVAFQRELRSFFELLHSAQQEGHDSLAAPPAGLSLQPLEERLLQIARGHGLDLTRPAVDAAQTATAQESMQRDLRDLFELLQAQRQTQVGFSSARFWDTLLHMVAEYTDQFNNDEVRAIFQEASLEHHMEGRLITPRYLGLKIGLIRKRRDERQVVHLDSRRGR